ncbi:hypothetical protein V8F20_011719 [Naviculisporaceae sp. PSN 640]
MRFEFSLALLVGAQAILGQRCQSDTLLRVMASNRNEAVPFCQNYLPSNSLEVGHDFSHLLGSPARANSLVHRTVVVTRTTTIIGTSTKRTTISKTQTNTRTNTNTEVSTATIVSPTIVNTITSTTTTTSFTPLVEKRAADVTGAAFTHILEGFASQSLSSACSCLGIPNTNIRTTTETVTETRRATKRSSTTKTSKTITTASVEVTVQTTTTSFTTTTVPTTTTTSTTAIETTVLPRAFRITFTEGNPGVTRYVEMDKDPLTSGGPLYSHRTDDLTKATIFYMSPPGYVYLVGVPEPDDEYFAYFAQLAEFTSSMSLRFRTDAEIVMNQWYRLSWDLDKDTKTLRPFNSDITSPIYIGVCPSNIVISTDPSRLSGCNIVNFVVEWVDDYW